MKLKENTQKSKIIHETAQYLLKEVIPNHSNGFTLDLFSSNKAFFVRNLEPDFYIVSLAGNEQRFTNFPCYEEISAWLTKHYENICRFGQYIGGWLEGDLFYLDISVAIRGKENALEVAAANNQLAIYHPAANQIVYTANQMLQATA